MIQMDKLLLELMSMDYDKEFTKSHLKTEPLKSRTLSMTKSKEFLNNIKTVSLKFTIQKITSLLFFFNSKRMAS